MDYTDTDPNYVLSDEESDDCGDDELQRPARHQSYTDEDVSRAAEASISLNIPLTDVGSNDFKWHSIEPNQDVRVPRENIIRSLPGLTNFAKPLGESLSPTQLWDLLIDQQIIEEIVKWTNLKLEKASQMITQSLRGTKRMR